MKLLFLSIAALSCLQFTVGLGSNLICYYEATSALRLGNAKFDLSDLEVALQFCTHLVYGYVGIKPDTFQLYSLNENLDKQQRHLAQVTSLKEKFPHVKFLLSVGGDRDPGDSDKYIQLLEAGRQKQTAFIQSASEMLKFYNFDGLDLAFQFPRNKPRKVHSDIGIAWKSFKKFFTGDYIVDEKSDEHREQFTDLVKDMKTALHAYNMMLSLTVLPNVNSSWYFNVPAIINDIDFVNLCAYDFLTPERNPEEADYTSPLYELLDQNRLPHTNVNFQVEYWLLQRVPANKINVGVGLHGRAWKMTKDSGTEGAPIVQKTEGAALPGPVSKTPGYLNWLEICAMLPNRANFNEKNEKAPIHRISDPSKRYGTYAFRPADDDGNNGVWVSYEDPDTASTKAGYAKVKNLGGIAMFDLSLDDFRGTCTGDKYPYLRAIKYRLL